MALHLTSSAFEHNGQIPKKYTCDGADINPPLAASGIPDGTKSLVLIVDDPDAPMGTWDHWIVFNIKPVAEVKENSVPEGGVQGINDFKKQDWGGPCPPSGSHRYFFKLYALDTMLDLDGSATKEQVEAAMAGHKLEETELIGIYQRS